MRLSYSVSIATLLCAASCVSASTFGVKTSAQAIANTGAGQNLPGGQASYDSNTGATTSVVNGSGSASASGTGNVTGLASSFDQANASNVSPNLTAYGYAEADLATGSLRAIGSGSSVVSPNGFTSLGQGVANAEFYDTLTFHVVGADSSTVTDFGVNFSIDGSVSKPGTGVSVVSVLSIPGAQAQFDYNAYQVMNSTPAVNYYGFNSVDIVSNTPSSFIFQGMTSGRGATFNFTVDLKLQIICQGATCDYSHTDLFNFSLPSNVTYTSASGLFLTQQSAVPEPASWWTMAFGSITLLVASFRARVLQSRAQI